MDENQIEENVVSEDEDAKRAANRVMNIKVIVTVAALALMVVMCIKFWNPDGSYQIELAANKDQGYVWTYTIEDDSILKEQQAYYTIGMYMFVFEGLKEGITEVEFTLSKDGEEQGQTKTYTLKVMKNKRVMLAGHIEE